MSKLYNRFRATSAYYPCCDTLYICITVVSCLQASLVHYSATMMNKLAKDHLFVSFLLLYVLFIVPCPLHTTTFDLMPCHLNLPYYFGWYSHFPCFL